MTAYLKRLDFMFPAYLVIELYPTIYLLCGMKQPVSKVKEITKQSNDSNVISGAQRGYALFSV